MTADIEERDLGSAAETRRTPSLVERLRNRGRAFAVPVFTSLTRRIVILNLAALVVLVSGILFLNQFRAGLIDSRITSLLIQGEIIASAIASSATVDADTIIINPEDLLDLQVGQSPSPAIGEFGELDFAINPERVAPVLRRLILPTGTRARIYEPDGTLILDSRHLYARGQILRFDVPPPEAQVEAWTARLWRQFNAWLSGRDLPLYLELGNRNGRAYEEVSEALKGQASSIVRINPQGELTVSVAVPIRRYRAVHGILLLSTQGGDIDDIVYAERLAIIRVFLVAAGVTVVLSILLASTIAVPLHRLSEAADRVRRGVSGRPEIPDFSKRGDEIGRLSRALGDMTSALFHRITAIENFAADVAHELKNPLTSLRSAVETLPLAKSEEERSRLSSVIQHDVRRLDRLISDISDASRLDAELARQEAAPVVLRELLEVVVSLVAERIDDSSRAIHLDFATSDDTYTVQGHGGRLAQVFTNLIDNAISFRHTDGEIRITARRADRDIEIIVEDEGPGIREDQFERIFDRFYTDRADTDGFGQNSGLGLSISKQIIEAHGGVIRAENVTGDETADGAAGAGIVGARFVIRLPTA
ncbi:MAG: stimulus-sensing domain-containing protein [Alphaproteobacteria bacterium]